MFDIEKEFKKFAVKDQGISSMHTDSYIKSSMNPVKILGNGKISKRIKISASAFSTSAKDKIEKAGGETIILWLIRLEQFSVYPS